IGGPQSKESYLNMTAVLSAAIATGCNAIHPGYGFLSENARFAEMVESCNLAFIGPSSKVIGMMGDKVAARRIAQENGIPVAPGSEGILEDVEAGLRFARRIGYPVMIKAANGGGGRGIAVVSDDEAFARTFARTSLEAESSFGDKSLYVEKYLERPRHIEVQILADKFGNVVHLGERDCSIQRRNQKVVEESPAANLSDVLRKKLGAAAVKLAKAVGYTNAGTMEFLVDADGEFYFIEMNTRIQVEHPVTEWVTGIDLVKEQIRIAYGNELSFRQLDVKTAGHAIECRICAEDPMNDFKPAPGTITGVIFPGGPGVRVDTHVFAGYVIPPYYDSLLAKLIVFAPTRKDAIRKMRTALEQFVIDGIKNNVEYLYLIMHDPDYVKGQIDTGFIPRFQLTIGGER
ncbi:MAG: acetyl-CoA carboxylase biotin carboxylase subunit, partial [Bacillota bacterium]|nr:acetyl-CoA carboxylase biotin carboxylase subunit [Bacillota bacterium]